MCHNREPDTFIDDEWRDWYRLTPAQRWRETEKLWDFYLAVEQDDLRINRMIQTSRKFQEDFTLLKKKWKKRACPLFTQHEQLAEIAFSLL